MTDGSQGQLRRDAEAGATGDRTVGEDGVVTRVRRTPSVTTVHLVTINAVYNNTNIFQLSYMSIITICYTECLKLVFTGSNAIQ